MVLDNGDSESFVVEISVNCDNAEGVSEKVTIKPKPPSMSPGYHEKWKTCYHCSAKHVTCELKYDDGEADWTVDLSRGDGW